MLTLDELKDKLRKRLIDLEGHVEPADLDDIIEEAKELGLTDEQIGRLVPEIDRTINWEHIRLEKEKAIEAATVEAERQAKRREEIDSAPEYLDALISYCMADGIVEEAELRVIFEKAKNLEQSLHALAVKVKGMLDKGRFRPYPNANLNADGLHEVLMSTSWYTDKTHPQAQQQQASTSQTTAAPPPPPLRIETFAVDKPQIRKGQFAKISWKVSGKGRINISNLGSTETMSGEQIVRPLVTTRYTLTAGTSQQSVDVVVKTTPILKQIGKVMLWIIGLFFGLCILIAILGKVVGSESGTSEAASQVSDSSTGPLVKGKVGAVNLTETEEQALIDVMNLYLRYQGEDDQSDGAIKAICSQYTYPVAQYFTKANATEAYVYDDAARYRRKYKPDAWKIIPERTKVVQTPEGYYTVDLEGMFSYYIRNPRKGNGYRERYVHNHYLLNPEYKIMSVYEVK